MSTTTANYARLTSATSTSSAHIRPEIQALRAVAVLGVLLFHLWPGRLPGGYVGVDVFFVVSGFLITGHLVREELRYGRISLPLFWARRARRLLPASLLVLVVTAVGVWIFVPDARWAQFGQEIIASVFYVENWALAAQSVDYMALSNAQSPVQHFWSLGVEEQFYIGWPLLVILAFAISGARAARPTRVLFLIIAAATALSLCYSIWSTAIDPSVAYFSTFTRAWEFGAGALLAVLMRRWPMPVGTGLFAATASLAGFAAIGLTMLTFSGDTPFPSYTALLPVVGTMLVVAAGTPRTVASTAPIIRWTPIQFLGNVSYGAYLWHWPIIVLLPYATGLPITTLQAVSVLALSIILGWVSKSFIEDPLRTARVVARSRPRQTFVGGLIAMMLVAGAALPLATFQIAPPATADVDSQPDCYGAAAMVTSSCGDPESIPLVASLSSFSVDLPPEDIRACERATTAGEYVRCDFGDLEGTGTQFALVGDSHATRLVEPLRSIAEAQGGSLSTFLVSGCSTMSTELTGSAWGFEPVYGEQCRSVTDDIQNAVVEDEQIDVIILTNRTRLYVTDVSEYRALSPSMVEQTIRRIQAAGKQVVVIADPPEMSAVPPQGGGSASDCLTKATSPSQCSLERSAATFDDPMRAAAIATNSMLIDLDDLFCTNQRCMTQIGGLVVYSDDNHLSRSYAMSMVDPLSERLGAFVPGD